MPDVLFSETCVCGSDHWHVMLERVLWCRRCGCVRLIFEEYWRVPLDRAGDIPATAAPVNENEDPPTLPGTPKAKSRTDMQAVIASSVELARRGGKPPGS